MRRVSGIRLLAAGLIVSFGLSACGVATSDEVVQPQASNSNAADTAPKPLAAGQAPDGVVSAAGDYTTTTKFAGPAKFKITEKHGFTDATVENGEHGFAINFVGPIGYGPTGGPTYAEQFNKATGGNYLYHGSSAEKVAELPSDAPITGFVCGDLSTAKKGTSFCVARYNGSSWWHYFGGKTWGHPSDASLAVGPILHAYNLCQWDVDLCVASGSTSAATPAKIWNAQCSGDKLADVTAGCMLPQSQGRIGVALYSPKTDFGSLCASGSAFAPYSCALINILPSRQTLNTKKDGGYTIAKDPTQWGSEVVCGKPQFTPEAGHGSIAASYQGQRGRNMAVLLRSNNGISDTRISGVLKQSVAPKGNCSDSKNLTTVEYTVNWDPRSASATPGSRVPKQSCGVNGAPANSNGSAYNCTTGSSFVEFKDQRAEHEAAEGADGTEVATEAFLFLLSEFLHIEDAEGDPAAIWGAQSAKYFAKAIDETSEPDAILYANLFTGATK